MALSSELVLDGDWWIAKVGKDGCRPRARKCLDCVALRRRRWRRRSRGAARRGPTAEGRSKRTLGSNSILSLPFTIFLVVCFTRLIFALLWFLVSSMLLLPRQGLYRTGYEMKSKSLCRNIYLIS